MSLQYRFIARDRRADSHDAARRGMAAWLREKKSIDADLSQLGRRIEAAGKEVSVTLSASDDLSVARYSLYEEGAGGRWATILTVITTANESWLWVDVEWVSEDPWGRTPVVSPPTLVQYLLLDESVHVDGLTLPPTYLNTTTKRQAQALATEVARADRHTPIVISSPDSQASPAENVFRGKGLARGLLGIAPVYVLSQRAQQAFNDALPKDLHLYGGAVRTFVPMFPPTGLPAIRRHRVMGSARLRSGLPRAIDAISSPLRIRALSARPPEVYRERGRELLQNCHDGGSDELLLADALAAEAAASAAKTAAAELQDQLEWQSLEMEEALSQLEGAEARIRFLTSQLAKKKVNAAAAATPASFAPPTIDSFASVLDAARDSLALVVVGETDESVSQLDGYAQAASWAKKSWRALAAMETYAEARRAGEQREFLAWCEAGEDPTGIPATWITPVESDSVNNNPRYRDARTFAVPPTVDEAGMVYMPAHIKIVQGGRPAPRVHFFDDTAGASGKVWVGYIGPHLPNDQTN